MLLKIENIHKAYKENMSFFKKRKKAILKGVNLNIKEGECVGLIGESGSGKSTLGKIIVGLKKADLGSILFEGKSNVKDFRKEISIVFQDYTSSVNPRFKVKEIIAEALSEIIECKKNLKEEIISLLNEVGLGKEFINRYPHELSGGQLQRVCIARAIATKPKFILLDEAVSSLDVSIQLQILDLLKKLKNSHKLSYLFITHDLMTVTYLCDKVIFFKDGLVVEVIDDINDIGKIKHPYSKSLFNAVKELEITL